MKGECSRPHDAECGRLSQHFKCLRLCVNERRFRCVDVRLDTWAPSLLPPFMVMARVSLSLKVFRCR